MILRSAIGYVGRFGAIRYSQNTYDHAPGFTKAASHVSRPTSVNGFFDVSNYRNAICNRDVTFGGRMKKSRKRSIP